MLTTMEDFCNAVINGLREQLGNGADISIRPTVKNNGVKLTGLAIAEEGSSISPIVYLEGYYQSYVDGRACLAEIQHTILECFHASRSISSFDTDSLACWEKARHRLAYRLVNYRDNRELLKAVPHKKFLDLAATCHYMADTGHPASILVQDSFLDMWGVTKEELFQATRETTPRLFPGSIRTMADVMAELAGGPNLHGLGLAGDMYVLTNRQQVYGAACILYPGLLKEFSDAIGDSFYILPSSIHEVILLPAGLASGDATELSRMVREINRTQVSREETLSDLVYSYSRASGKITMHGVCHADT